MEETEERVAPDVITSDTENATKVQPKDAPPSKRAKFRRFRAYNTGTWNGPKRENTEQLNRQDDLHRYDAIASSLHLNKRQKKRGRNILDEFDSHEFGESIDYIIFGICVVVANADVNDGVRYWPSEPSEDTSQCSFQKMADSIGIDWRKQSAIIEKVRKQMEKK